DDETGDDEEQLRAERGVQDAAAELGEHLARQPVAPRGVLAGHVVVEHDAERGEEAQRVDAVEARAARVTARCRGRRMRRLVGLASVGCTGEGLVGHRSTLTTVPRDRDPSITIW